LRDDTPYADCDYDTNHAGNPWAISPVKVPPELPGYEPTGVHFCLDKRIKLDEDHSG
jgi:hypothetical protein